MQHIGIIGAGISGLTAAYRLQQKGYRVTVLEASPRPGGAVQTTRFEDGLMEGGPDSLLSSKPAALELARELDLPMVRSCAEGPPGVVKNGRILPLPQGFRLLAPTQLLPFAFTPLLSVPGKLRTLMETLMPVRKESGDESVGEFVRRRFGREVLECLAQPLLGGIYSADPQKLSLQATLPFFRSMELKQGSIIKGLLNSTRGGEPPTFWAPRDGMQALVDALAERLGTASLQLSRPVSSIVKESVGWRVVHEQGQQVFQGLILACPAHRAAGLLKDLSEPLAESLATIPYTSTATLNMVCDKRQIGAVLRGSGFVVPHAEFMDITACTYAHKKYPGRAPLDKAVLRVHMGGELNRELMKRSDSQLIATAVSSVRPLLKLRGEPELVHLVRHHKVVPQYAVGHLTLRRNLEALLDRFPTLELAGNGLAGVGLSDCVTQAEACVERIRAGLSQKAEMTSKGESA